MTYRYRCQSVKSVDSFYCAVMPVLKIFERIFLWRGEFCKLDKLQERLDEVRLEMDRHELKLDELEVKLNETGGQHLEWPADRVRTEFIKYFVEKRDHVFWSSSPVVPVNDPTLLFANSGMTQFKPLFLGTCDPSQEMFKLTRAVNSQKCIRAGGKHNDLEDVGKDVYHHTFFEMLGNWGFGSYFKEEAICWAWECLIEVFGLAPERIYVTYFGGDEKLGLPSDEEAKAIWSRFLPLERILPFGCKDNFWEMGPTGPCGPCSEIHFDRIGGRDASKLVNADRPDVIEIWNNVFMQFNREADGSLKELPSKHIDTGMGLERLTSILQNKDSNYDTDLFMPIFKAIQSASGCRPYSARVGAEDVDLVDMAYRVVADHIRTLTFAITDGAVPSSEGRGYVLRRILRRAVRYGQEILKAPSGFFTSLVPIVVQNFSGAFPELLGRKDFVMGVLQEEELSFNRTLDLGVQHFNKVVQTMKAAGVVVVPAKDAHILYTSMGFPLDLTELMAAERQMTVDVAGFNELMENDRLISQQAENARRLVGQKDLTMEAEQTAFLGSSGVPTTDTSSKYVWLQNPECRVVALFQGRGGLTAGFVDSVTSADGAVGVILDTSSFYYESGGQVSDTGELVLSTGERLPVSMARTYAGYTVHTTTCGEGVALRVGDVVHSCVNYERRADIAPNHTMTHVLNYAIRKVLIGDGDVNASAKGNCDQKGSFVDNEKLRFDFAWNGSLTADQIAEIEGIVNRMIAKGLGVFTLDVPLASAKEISSLRSVFGENYPDPVRVVSVGAEISSLLADPKSVKWSDDISVEFCGGTHLQNTQQAESFALVEECGIAKGVRRIVGLTRSSAGAARSRAAELLRRLDELKATEPSADLVSSFKTIKVEIDQVVVSLVDKELMKAQQVIISGAIKNWYKANLATRSTAALSSIDEIAQSNQEFVVQKMDFGADGKVAKKIQDRFKELRPDASFFLYAVDDEDTKIGVYVVCSPSHVAKGADARKWCDLVTSSIGAGKGGGKDVQATASIPVENGNAEELLVAVQNYAVDYVKSFSL